MSIVLSVSNINKSYGNNHVLKNVSFEIQQGKIVGLLGPNGSGKTTLLKIINTLITDYTGDVAVYGNPLGIKSKELISFLPDNNFLREELRINQMIEIYNDFFSDFDKVKAYEMLYSLKLDKKNRIGKLSKGMAEKLQLVLIMARKAKLYIFDEPLAGVDPASRDYIIETIISNFWEEGSILLSTHLISDVERILDRVIMIKEGQIIIDKDSDTLRSDSGKSVDAIFREVFKC